MPFKGGLWFKLHSKWLLNLIPAFGLSAYASFSGDERERGSPRHEGRKSSQRDARRRALSAWRAPMSEMKRDACKTEGERQLVSIAWFKWREAVATKHSQGISMAFQATWVANPTS
ncbi:hypothetical protein A3841_04365 [Pontibacter flavimaris]|uniref:Uncharacterized protein n=1 Tax=Pontibacter flavimaris TaxID=1797110 RepID=A0A1Q5PAL5_9BACT|nr:hypothetical protein A3841_04365 [Pontibacter flavimaris]